MKTKMKTITIHNFLLVFIALFFSGCLTKNLFQETLHYKHYEDKIIYYDIDKEHQKILFVGEKYHYIFNSNETLVYLMTHSEKKNVIFDVNRFPAKFIANKEKMTARFNIKLKPEMVSDELIEWGIKNNFHKTIDDGWFKKPYYKSDMYLEGYRYLPNDVGEKLTKIEKPLKISVAESYLDRDYALSLMLSPIALTVDAAGLLTVVVLSGAAYTGIAINKVIEK
jgi:hypothetical protein